MDNYISLNNNVKMPLVGLGIYKITDEKELENVVSWAIDFGYRSFDTAQFYNNEKELGSVLRKSKVAREKLFITTKIWNTNQGYDRAVKSFEESLKKLNMDYVDLLLIHWPGQDIERYVDTWRALERIYQRHLAKAIGLSNFCIKHLENIFARCYIAPTVNQIERHPFLNQAELIEYCRNHHIAIEAWSPLIRGKIDEPVIIKIAEKHNKTSAQIILKWNIQNGVSVIPKSVHKDRIKENIDIFDFMLDGEDMEKIDSLNNGYRIGDNPLTFDF